VVEFVKELPRHIDGKLVKRELEDKYWQGIEREDKRLGYDGVQNDSCPFITN